MGDCRFTFNNGYTYWQLHFSSWSSNAGSITFTNANSATTTATIGGPGTITATFTPIITTPPTTSISLSGTPGQNGWYDSAVTVTLTATDNSGTGIKAIYYSINGGATQTIASSSGSFTISTAGLYSVSYWAADNSGKTGTAQTATVLINLTNPTTTASASGTLLSGPTNWYVGSATITLTANEQTSGIHYIYYSLNGGAWSTYTVANQLTYTASTSFTVSTQGANTIEYYSVDYSGDTDSTHTLAINIAYSLTFVESGLPSGTTWSVTVGGTTTSTTGNLITVPEPSGSISWSVLTPISGSTGTQYAASSASGSVNLPTTAPVSIAYSTQYYLTVTSAYSTPTGAGWYPSASLAYAA